MKKCIIIFLSFILLTSFVSALDYYAKGESQIQNWLVRRNKLIIHFKISNYNGNIPIESYNIVFKIKFSDGSLSNYNFRFHKRFVAKYKPEYNTVKISIGEKSVEAVSIEKFKYKTMKKEEWEYIKKKRRKRNLIYIISGSLLWAYFYAVWVGF